MSSFASTGSSESDSTEEEERLRRLFSACDRDRDGYIDSEDLRHMCHLLNMEDAVDEIIHHLGIMPSGGNNAAPSHGRISFADFVRCRLELGSEVEHDSLAMEGAVTNQLHCGLSSFRDIPLQTPDNSETSLGCAGTSSQDCDSGARDFCTSVGTVDSLYKLLELQRPDVLHTYMTSVESCGLVDFLQHANALHLAAMSSLKGELIDVTARLQRLHVDKETLDKQFAKLQVEKLRMQSECEERMEQQAVHNEDRITELQSVIAELRKKLDQRQTNVILEEDEDSDGIISNASVEDGSVSEHANVCSIADSCVVAENEALDGDTTDDDDVVAMADNLPSKSTDIAVSPACAAVAISSSDTTSALAKLKSENVRLVERISQQDAEIRRLHAELKIASDDRDACKRKLTELQKRSHDLTPSSPVVIRDVSQGLNSPSHPLDKSAGSPASSPVSLPVSKVAELKKLKTSRQDRHVLGAELSSLGVSNVKVAEHLAAGVQACSRVQEIVENSSLWSSPHVPDSVVHEFEIELEQLQSRVDHLKAQNDLLTLTLAESKSHCNHLTILIGKYESNVTAHQLSTAYADQALNTYRVLVQLVDTELSLLASKCQVLGVCGYDRATNTTVLQMAVDARRVAECAARQLLNHVDSVSTASGQCGLGSPWDDLSSSRTPSSVSSIASTSDDVIVWTKSDETRLRQRLTQLRDDRSLVKLTIVELESIHPFTSTPKQDLSEAQKLDLENAVLMQELMSMKEERAELKAVNHRMVKEISQLKLNVHDYRSDVTDHSKTVGSPTNVTVSTISCISVDLEEALKREGRLKDRIHELMRKLDKSRELDKNSELRHQQSVSVVTELKKVNSTLVSAFEKAKKKYVARLKKMEAQMAQMTERHESQTSVLRQKLFVAEDQLRQYQPSSSPTSV